MSTGVLNDALGVNIVYMCIALGLLVLISQSHNLLLVSVVMVLFVFILVRLIRDD